MTSLMSFSQFHPIPISDSPSLARTLFTTSPLFSVAPSVCVCVSPVELIRFLPKYKWEVTHWGTDNFSGAGYTTEETKPTKTTSPAGRAGTS